MSIRGPWYITLAACEDYLRILGLPLTDDNLDDAAVDLERIAEETLASTRQPQILDSGALRYKGPNPRKLSLVVVTDPRSEGSKPQLVSVTTPRR